MEGGKEAGRGGKRAREARQMRGGSANHGLKIFLKFLATFPDLVHNLRNHFFVGQTWVVRVGANNNHVALGNSALKNSELVQGEFEKRGRFQKEVSKAR
jgi:hypothetical protein